MTTVTLNTEQLLYQASERVGLTDYGDLPFREGIDVLLWSLQHESGNPPERVAQIAASLVLPALVKRLRLVDDRKRYPEIAAQAVRAPIVITGLPRTGSTHLQALLATRPGARSPAEWEMRLPSPPPEAATAATDPRIAEVQRSIDERPGAARLQSIHPYGARRPEQCLGLIDWSFANQTYLAYQRIPSYYEWYLDADQRVVYEHHKRFLQHLQFRNPGEWVLKWPKHLFGLDALLEAYPDARIVWTHRDPARVVPSAVSFVGTLRSMNSPVFDPRRFGAEWSALEEMGLHRGLEVRDRVGDDRFLDVQYNDLITDPVAAVSRIYEHFGLPVDDETIRRVGDFQEENPQGKHGAHDYTPEQFGFEPERVRRRFAAYTQRFGIERDRLR
ncbi:sulfotransferase family protein [Trebonia kvetii]|uniref:sulfotransferase family protein n=1 Tax=Trebonia kvetii TaxID=2480626 RepID=UPI001651B5BA|nr:sulfotransferase [Trebonia kvetii]